MKTSVLVLTLVDVMKAHYTFNRFGAQCRSDTLDVFSDLLKRSSPSYEIFWDIKSLVHRYIQESLGQFFVDPAREFSYDLYHSPLGEQRMLMYSMNGSYEEEGEEEEHPKQRRISI